MEPLLSPSLFNVNILKIRVHGHSKKKKTGFDQMVGCQVGPSNPRSMLKLSTWLRVNVCS